MALCAVVFLELDESVTCGSSVSLELEELFVLCEQLKRMGLSSPLLNWKEPEYLSRTSLARIQSLQEYISKKLKD